MCCHRWWIVLVILLSLPIAASAQVELRWKLKPQGTFTLETISKLNQLVQTATQAHKQDVIYKTRTRYTVVKVTPEESILVLKVEGFEATLPDGRTMPTAVRQELRDAEFRLKLDSRQRVVGVEGIDDFLNKVTGEDPNLQKALNLMLSKEGLLKVVQQAFAYLPDQPVKEGDRWERLLILPLGPLGAFQVKNTYTLEKPERMANRLCHRIGLTCTVSFDPPKNTNLPFAIIGGEFRTTAGQGTIWFDAAAGEIVRSVLQLHLQGKLTVETQGKTSTIELRQEQSIEVRRVIMEE